jgi:predicted HicB family RNase H-like nuclease
MRREGKIMARARPSLSTALNARQQPPTTEAPEETHERAAEGKAVGFSLRLGGAAHEQLRRMAFDSRRSIHALVIEALNDLFTKHGKPPIA